MPRLEVVCFEDNLGEQVSRLCSQRQSWPVRPAGSASAAAHAPTTQAVRAEACAEPDTSSNSASKPRAVGRPAVPLGRCTNYMSVEGYKRWLRQTGARPVCP